jgi:response regulator RpfG family c-di-GMP phosphodiesterase
MPDPTAPLNTDKTWPQGYDAAPVVLLVDDEANILSSLRRLLRPDGWQILTANGGEEALTVLRSQVVDLVISDMRMPVMDGAQLLAQVRQHWPATMRILLTGYADIKSTIAAINQGQIYRYIAKPWNDDDMRSVVEDALKLRGLEQDNQRLRDLTLLQNEELKALNSSLEDKVRIRTEDLRQTNERLVAIHEKLKKSFITSIRVFSNLIELRAGGLSGHGRRVADLAKRLGEKMGLPAADVQDIMLAGLLHDIGKIGFPDKLLAKPVTRMDAEELALLRKHPVKGATALMALEDLQGVAKLIRHHQERFDGLGYPDGLSGLAIPPGARVLALARDFFSVQTGDFAERKLTPEEAQAWTIKGRGTRYDPQVVDAFLELVQKPPVPAPRFVQVKTKDLKPGMVLARDFTSDKGVLLLAADYLLDSTLIRQIHELEESEGTPIVLTVHAPKDIHEPNPPS